jgi:serine/threonine-protein kinase
VKVTPEGLVKVLDFGLAKGGAASSNDLAQSPTLTYSPTAIGVILGTAGYMSPEQARGKPVDRRADIWAFACVLYECLTGRKVFEGETVSDTIARIIEREPDFDALPPATPPAVRELLRRCLEKDIRKRQRDIGDVRIELESALAARSSASVVMRAPAAPASRSVWSRWAVPALFAIVGAAAGIALWTMVRPAPSTISGETVSLSIEVPSTFRPTQFAFGMDGKSVVGLGNPKRSDGTEDPHARLYVRQLAGFDFAPIPGTEGVKVFALSPDGKSVAVVRPVSDQSSDSVLVTLPIDGSSPAFKVADWGRDWSDQEDLQWLRNGDILIQTSQRTKFLRLPSGGGPAKPPVAFDIGQAPGYPTFSEELPDGRGVLIRMEGWGAQGYQQDICVLDANTGKITRLIENAAQPHFDASTGTLFFSRGSTLMAVPFDSVDAQSWIGSGSALRRASQ